LESVEGQELLKQKLPDAVADAWGTLNLLQNEVRANDMNRELAELLQAKVTKEVTLDKLQAHVRNSRKLLDSLMEEDRDLYDEQQLLKALKGLQHTGDPERINLAVQDANIQLQNVAVTEKHTDALKTMYAHFKSLQDPEADKAKILTALQADIKKYAPLVVQLAALEDNPDPMRDALVMAHKLVEAGPNNLATLEAHVKLLTSQIIVPEVALHCSAPKSDKLNTLMASICSIVEAQQGKLTSKAMTTTLIESKEKVGEVQNEMDDHRNRLAYRNRMQFKKKSAVKIDLREAEAGGAQWEGFRLEDHDALVHYEDSRSEVEKSFDAFDINKDGEITIAEVIEYLLSVPQDKRPPGLEDVNPFKKKSMEKRLRKMDTDGDGKLSFEEFQTWWNATQP
jgi:hypothetical protein